MSIIILFTLLNCSYSNQGVEINYRIDSEFTSSQLPEISEGTINEPVGYPAIKTISFLVGVPQQGKIDWQLSPGYTQYLDGIDISPVQKLSFEGRKIKRAEIYKENNYFPDPVIVEGPFNFRDMRVIRVKLAPVRYNPVQHKLAINHVIRLKIKFQKKGVRKAKRGSAFEDILKEMIINYEQCKNWRIDQQVGTSQFPTGIWYRMKVSKTGVYQIKYRDLQEKGVNPKLIDPRTVKIFTSSFHTLPRYTPIEFADSLVEVPIFFQGGEDGRFDPDDYFIFYARHASWTSIYRDSLHFNLNPYTDTNCYWLTWSGESGSRMEMIDGTRDGFLRKKAISYYHLEEEEINLARSGLRWLWREILTGDSIYISHPGADGKMDLNFTFFRGYERPIHLQLYLDQELIFDDTVIIAPYLNKLSVPASVTGDSSLLKIIRPEGGSVPIYLNYVNFVYERWLTLDSSINILSYQDNRNYKVSNVDKRPFLLDITDELKPELFYNIKIDNGALQFKVQSDSVRNIFITKEVITPQLELINPGRLKNERIGADYLILTPKIFKNDVLPLLYYRRKTLSIPNPKVMLITLQEIYDEFAVGKFDPTAIRNFLYHTTQHWEHIPSYVLFVGDGSYDYKNNIGRTNPSNYFPPYERDASFVYPDANDCYDDWYVTFTGSTPEMIIGRLPIQSRGQLRLFIKKILRYESGNYQGDWQNRILLFADDEYGKNGGWEWGGTWAHAANCESALCYIPEAVEPRKVYSMIYGKEEGNTRPEASQAFIDNLNEGTYLSLYYGHGNHHQIAHEKIFMYEDISRINSNKRYFIIYFGSCGVSRFDDTKWESIGEDLMRTSGKSIATLGATRGTSCTPNLILGNYLSHYLWRGYAIGDATYLAKQHAGTYNTKLYHLFSDPATKSIASQDELTLAVQPDTIVPTGVGTVFSTPEYEAMVYLRDSVTGWKDHLLQPPHAPDSLFTFQLIGSSIFKGRTNNESLNFSIPKFNAVNAPVLRINIFQGGLVGMVDSIPVAGTAPPSADHEGPTVKLYYGGGELEDSAQIKSPATIMGRVEDPAGINIATCASNYYDYYGQGKYGFAAILNGNLENAVDLRRNFVFDLNSYTNGTFRFTLELPEQHISDTLTITALDNLQNLSETSYLLFGVKEERLDIENFLIYPNPIRQLSKPIHFTFILNGTGYGTIEIYTVAGRCVDKMKDIPVTNGFNDISWQPSDIGNGTYLVKLTVVGSEGKKESEIERFIIAQ